MWHKCLILTHLISMENCFHAQELARLSCYLLLSIAALVLFSDCNFFQEVGSPSAIQSELTCT